MHLKWTCCMSPLQVTTRRWEVFHGWGGKESVQDLRETQWEQEWMCRLMWEAEDVSRKIAQAHTLQRNLQLLHHARTAAYPKLPRDGISHKKRCGAIALFSTCECEMLGCKVKVLYGRCTLGKMSLLCWRWMSAKLFGGQSIFGSPFTQFCRTWWSKRYLWEVRSLSEGKKKIYPA